MKKTERVYLQKIADLGCIVCKKLGYEDTPAEIHHIKRFGAKRDHLHVFFQISQLLKIYILQVYLLTTTKK